MQNAENLVIQSSIIPISTARSGKKLNDFLGVTFHETGNYRKSATAQAHAVYMNAGGKNSAVSSHAVYSRIRNSMARR